MKSITGKLLLLLSLIILPSFAFSQLQLRDSLLSWTHHSFNLNADYSMNNYSTADNVRERVQFNAKVIENDLIRLTIIPEYGARIISFIYKPTGHEYLYQSECGSPYGMNDGNFYYDWLMVYGGIFPTFPEPEHGKTWLLPWDYSVVKNTADTVIIGMEYTDNNSFSRTPGKFNNGITGITCRIEIGVYKGCSRWDFNVSLRNNKNQNVKYEYWTCTTLSPGSNPGDTGCPLNTEMLVPIDQYRAGWSPGRWIGNYNGLYDFSEINLLSKWTDMGIAYAHNLKDNYWGVINHENGDGIFRISENTETPGMKFWTWGKNNIDNDLYDFSNGGQDNYIELWAGVSEAFFEDAGLSAFEEKNWLESYVPTVNMSSVGKINRDLAANISWDEESSDLGYEIFSFNPGSDNRLLMYLDGDAYYSIIDKNFYPDVIGNSEVFDLNHIPSGNYTAYLEVYDGRDELKIKTQKNISLVGTGIENLLVNNASGKISIRQYGSKMYNIVLPLEGSYRLDIFNINGQLVSSRIFVGDNTDISFRENGSFILSVQGKSSVYRKKIVVN